MKDLESSREGKTLREIYEQHKCFYNKKSKTYIDEYLKNIGDIAHRPNIMKTMYSRNVFEKVSENKYIEYNALVKSINYDDFGDIVSVNCDKNILKTYNLESLISTFGNSFAQNPRHSPLYKK